MTSPIAAPYKYNATAKGLMMWAQHELEHVGRIAAVEDENIQYSYALSTLNGMAHLKDALYEFVSSRPDEHWTQDLLTIHEQVVRVMKHLIKDYDLDVDAIEEFNVKGVLSNLNYLRKENEGKEEKENNTNLEMKEPNERRRKARKSRKDRKDRKTRKNRKSRKNRKIY
jgi:hypothetical protein